MKAAFLSRLVLAAAVLALAPASRADQAEGTVIELSASATELALNDLGRATLYAEASSKDTAELASRINARIARALETASRQPAVKAQSGAVSTWPVYGKEPGERIEAWRMRAEIRLESRDLDALSTLVGELQEDLLLASLDMDVARETRLQAVDTATRNAIAAFRARAALVAGALEKSFRIRELSIDDGNYRPMPRMSVQSAPAGMLAAAAPLPLSAGESEVSVRIHGRIELID